MLNALIVLVSIALGCVVIYDIADKVIKNRAEQRAEEEKKAMEKRQRAQELRLKEESAYKAKCDALVASYGPCTTDVVLSSIPNTLESHMFVYEESSTLVLKGEVIPFSKVLGFSLNDETQTIVQNNTQYVSTTKTSTGNMLGRAVVGGVLLGGVGALAGAATAKKETTTIPLGGASTASTKHKYTLFINLDDLSNPTREVKLGYNTQLAQNLANIFNIIIKRNSQNEA